MNSWEDLEQEALEDSRRICVFGRYLEGLDYKAQEFVDSALSNNKIGIVSLTRALSARGYKGSRDSLALHRAKECVCSKVSV